MKILIRILLLLSVFNNLESHAQKKSSDLTANEKYAVLQSLKTNLLENYIFPDKAHKAINFLEARQKSGSYEKISDPNKYAEVLTNDIMSVIKDKHFNLFFDPERTEDELRAKLSKEDEKYLEQKELEKARRDNFGFKELRILDGNIGYLNLTGFYDLKNAAQTVNSTMRFFEGTSAIIIDLRYNRGGASDLAQYLTSFFFNDETTLLFDFHTRQGNKTDHKQYLTFPYVEGRRRPELPVYILTSQFSFSASEGFSYSMQSTKRATVIGETTGGGANMWTGKIIDKRFYAHIPNARPVDPRTQTNWEGIGVAPDLKVSATLALPIAHALALEKLTLADSANASSYKWHLATAKSNLKPIQITEEHLKKFVGNYEGKSIIFEDGQLYLRWKGTNCKLIPMSENLFRVDEFDYFRLEFIYDTNDQVSLKIINDNGSEFVSMRVAN
jgi:hypothetical protein